MLRIHAPNFSLEHTLASGQLFRYERVQDGYLVAHGTRAFIVRQEGDELLVPFATNNVTSEWLTHFFAIEESAPEPTDEYSRRALAYCKGLRICNQEPWECTLAFICSANNNVPRIRQLMNGLARGFGTPLHVGQYTAYAFPEPGAIVDGEVLRTIKAGYRARYLLAASNALTHELLEGIHGHSYADAREALQLIEGVGPKVADCILLFAYGHTHAFPIDTWVHHIMRTRYGCRTKNGMRRKAQKLWGARAGVMQQYLFHYERTGARA